MCEHLDSQISPTRRSALLGALGIGGGLLAASVLPASEASATPRAAAARAADATTGDRVVMLGTNGGPKLNSGLAKPAIALVVDERVYLVDCGYDTPNQLVAAGLGFPNVHHVFITHQHFDHTSGVPGLVLHGWTDPKTLPERLHLWGPPSTSRLAAGVEKTFGQDIHLFEAGGGFGTFPTVKGHDVEVPRRRNVITQVMEDDHVVVHATRVSHGPEVRDPYAYRFTIKSSGKKVVFSGDTAAPNANLINLAQGCDLLVHEAQDNDLIPVLLQYVPEEQRDALEKHLLVSHSNVVDLPAVAQAAGAASLAFCHYTPLPQPASVFLSKAQDAADEIGYAGTILAPVDLDVIAL